jgi:hypothetical protein
MQLLGSVLRRPSGWAVLLALGMGALLALVSLPDDRGATYGQMLPSASSRPAVVHDGTWYLYDSPAAGAVDSVFTYGLPGDIPLLCDWNGDGVRTPGVFREGGWHLRHSSSTGAADGVFAFGLPGDIPVCGDWDGNGTETPGIVRGGTWYLRNSNSSGEAEIIFADRPPADSALGRPDGAVLGPELRPDTVFVIAQALTASDGPPHRFTISALNHQIHTAVAKLISSVDGAAPSPSATAADVAPGSLIGFQITISNLHNPSTLREVLSPAFTVVRADLCAAADAPADQPAGSTVLHCAVPGTGEATIEVTVQVRDDAPAGRDENANVACAQDDAGGYTICSPAVAVTVTGGPPAPPDTPPPAE